MTKHKRSILIGCALLAVIALAGLTVVAFAQGEAAPSFARPSLAPGFDIVNSDQAALFAPDLFFQEQATGRGARPFAQDKMRENLAQALGITPEELDAARWQAWLATLEDAVEEGHLAPKKADRLLTLAVLKQTTGRDALIAAGLDITVAELEEARAEGKTPQQLAAELGLDAAMVGQNLAAALEQIVQQAVEDGLINEDQATRILDGDLMQRLAQGQWRPWLRHRQPGRVNSSRQSGFISNPIFWKPVKE